MCILTLLYTSFDYGTYIYIYIYIETIKDLAEVAGVSLLPWRAICPLHGLLAAAMVGGGS